MTRIIQFLLLAIFLIQAPSCLITPPDPPPVLWMNALNFETNTPIRNLYASPTELLVISDDEFIRLGPKNELKERRILPVPFEFYSWPVLADHTFARVIRTQAQGSAILELSLTAIPDEVLTIPYDNLKDDPAEIFAPVSRNAAEHTLAYNDLGTQLIVPVVNFEGNSYVFFLIDIELDFSKTKFINVKKTHRIDIPDIPASVTDRVNNIVFENGYYYVISLDGTFRISPDGSYEKVIPTWLFDVFEKNDTLFGTGRGLDFYVSTNNGLSWVERDSTSDLKFVEVIGNKVLTQTFPGAIYQMADEELQEAIPLVLNVDFPNESTSNAYAKLLYFYDSHYLVVQKELYFSCGLRREEN